MRSPLKKIIEILDGSPAEHGRREGGQSVVELAVVMPILLLLLVGLIEMGWFTNNYLILLEASRVGAREGTKQVGDSSPFNWEEGTVTIQEDDNETVGVDESRDLDTISGIIAPHALRVQGVDVTEMRIGGTYEDSVLARGATASDETPCEVFLIGFYTNVACATLESMAPLDQTVIMTPLEDMLPPGDTDEDGDVEDPNALPHPWNDIVVSAFSLNRIPAVIPGGCSGDVACINTNSLAGPYRTKTGNGVDAINAAWDALIDSAEDDIDAIQADASLTEEEKETAIAELLADIERYESYKINYTLADRQEEAPSDNTAAAQVMVTGRFPSNANECQSDWRDPFDINDNGQYDAFEIDDARLNVLNRGGVLMDRAATDQPDVGGESLRGFALTGKWRATNTEGCRGSEWDLLRIERLVNLRSQDPTEADTLRLPERQGLVLVEIFWRHELLIDLPLFDTMLTMFGAGGAGREEGNEVAEGYIKVWAAFPMSTVNFDLDLDQICDDLLFFGGTDDPATDDGGVNDAEYEDDGTTILECEAPTPL